MFQVDTIAFEMLGFEKVCDYGAPVFNSAWFGERAFAATGFDDDFHDISQTLSQRARGCEQVAGVIRDFPVNRTNMGEEDYLVVSVLKPEDIEWGGPLRDCRQPKRGSESHPRDDRGLGQGLSVYDLRR